MTENNPLNGDAYRVPPEVETNAKSKTWQARALELVKSPKVLTFIAVAVGLGALLIVASFTLRPSRLASLEAEDGTLKGAVSVKEDVEASGGKYVTFEAPKTAAAPTDKDVLAATDSAPTCPQVSLTRTGSQTADINQANNGGTWNLTSAVWDENAPVPITYPVRSESWTRGCINGGVVNGNTPRNATRDQWYNGADGFQGGYTGEPFRQTLADSPDNFLVIRDAYASDYEDAFDPNAARTDSTTYLDHVHAEYIRDDCIENEDRVHNMVLSGSLLDGCFTAFGFRPSGSTTAQNGTAPATFTVEDSLVYVKPQPLGPKYCGDTSVSRGRCATTATPNAWSGSYGIWKWSNQAPSKVVIRNTVFRLDMASYSSCSSQKWPAGTYDNVTLVWTGAGSYSTAGGCNNTLPAGVTLTTDVSVWDKAKQAWLAGSSDPVPNSVSCSTNNGVGVVDMNMSLTEDNNYRAWARMKGVGTNNSFKLLVDDQCFLVGNADNSDVSTDNWTWINFINGDTDTPLEMYLNSGNHDVKLIASEPNVSVDALLFTPNKECVPTDTGENCLEQDEPDTTAPTVSITAPTGGSTVSDSVNVTANAQDTAGINRVEFFVNGQLRFSDTGSPHAYLWDTTKDTNGSYKLSAKAYDDSGNVGASSEVTVNVSNTAPAPDPTPSDPAPTIPPVTSGNTVLLAPIADSFVKASEPNRNFGNSNNVEADGSPKKIAYLKYDLSSLSGKSLESAKLKMKVTSSSSNTYEVKGSADTSWGETTINYNNKPALGSTVGKVYGMKEGEWADTDNLSGALAPNLGKTITLAVESSGSNGFDFRSRNSTTEYPHLFITLKGVESPQGPAPTPGSMSTLTFGAAEDATIVAGSPDKNYGSEDTVIADGSPTQQFLMKFNVSGLSGRQVSSAKLRLYVESKSDKGGSFHAASSSWSQSSVTWNNAPAAGLKITELGAVKADTWIEVDLTSYIRADGTYSVRVQPQSRDGADYASSEADNKKPQLVLLVQ